MKEMTGVELTCREVKNGRIYPTPSYTPSIYRVMLLDDGTFRVTDVITLKDRDGRPLNGMPNPLRTATTETPLDGAGKRLQQDVRGIDAEGLVVLSDGSFWVGEENAPSFAHFGADGRMITRHVPAGTEGDFAGAPYETVGSLPAIVAKRQSNRGIEAVAVSPDERFLYFIMQNPLANPDRRLPEGPQHPAVQLERHHARGRRNTFTPRRSAELPPRSVVQAERSAHQRNDGRRPRPLIVDERTELTTKLYEIELPARPTSRALLGRRGDAADPGAERSAAAEIVPLKKTLRFDTADHPDVVGKTEGMTLLGDGALALINDDDFGISGGRTQIAVIRGTEIKRR